jgi:hypothetical protein
LNEQAADAEGALPAAELAPAFAESAQCAYCQGSRQHAMRQRCPLAPPPPPPPPGVFADDVRRYAPAAPRSRGRVQRSPFGFLRFLGAAAATPILLSSLGIYFVLLFDDLTSAYQAPGRLLALIGIAAAVGVILGAGLLWLSARAFSKVVFALVSVVLVTCGSFMLVFAPVYRQIDDPGIAEYRASNAMYIFGAITLAAGIVLAGLCVRWAAEPDALRALNRWRRPMGAAYGVVMGLFGLLLLSLLGFALSADDLGEEELGVVAGVISFTSLGMMFFVPGIILTYHGISSSMGERSAAFKAPVGLVIVAVFAAVVGIGTLNMRMESPIAAPMPVLHTLAAVLPGVAYIAFAARGSFLRGRAVGGVSWRQVTLAWGLAIAIGAMSASVVNSIGGLLATVLVLVQNGAFDGITTFSRDSFIDPGVWDIIFDAEFYLTSNEQWVVNILGIAIIPPFAEEFLKGLNVRLLMQRRTTRAQAFLLGAAAGAGFGFVEALLYGAGVTSVDLGDWWRIMLIRGGSSSLHCVATGLVGVGWWYWSIGGRKKQAVVLYLTAVLLHATWNGFSVTLDSELFWVGTLDDKTLERIAYGFVILFGAFFVSAIPLIARILREPPPPPVAGTALGAMTPWLG